MARLKVGSELAALALSGDLTELELSVSDVATLIFEIQVRALCIRSWEFRPTPAQELRHAAVPTPAAGPAAPTDEIDASLLRLNERLEALTAEFATMETRAAGLDSVFLTDKLDALSESWRAVQADADTLHEELKEDKCPCAGRLRAGGADLIPFRARRVSHSRSAGGRDDGLAREGPDHLSRLCLAGSSRPVYFVRSRRFAPVAIRRSPPLISVQTEMCVRYRH